MTEMIFRLFRKRNSSPKNTNTVYSESVFLFRDSPKRTRPKPVRYSNNGLVRSKTVEELKLETEKPIRGVDGQNWGKFKRIPLNLYEIKVSVVMLGKSSALFFV